MNASSPFTFSIRDLQTGCEIVSRISLANPRQAEIDINRFLDSLLAAPPDGEIYFRLLEHARLPIAFIAEELAKRYLNKALPLADLEEKIFQQVVSLWLKTARAYAHCAEKDSPENDDFAHVQRVAMILHRCIHHTGMAIVEHQRARREYQWGLWLDLHGYFGSAEEWGVATLAIPDALESLGRSTHCTAAYIGFLLCDMAGCYSLSVREQVLVRRWAIYWSPLASLHKAEPGEALPQFVVDLMQDIALRPVADCLQTEYLRRLDTSRLAMQISQTRQQLRQKIPPSQLALGDGCTAGQCNRLLEHLSRPWSQARAPRKFRRHATSGITKLCTGFEEMHYYISGKEFEQPENVRTYSRREFDSLFAFRHQENPMQVLQVHQEQLAYCFDTWEVVNQSANGFRLMRSTSGKKMLHGQLLALCPHDGERFLLAQTTWLMQEKGGGLIAGIKALPGMPEATAARSLDQVGEQAGKYHRAFLMPAVPSVEAEQSLVLPQGWFQPGRIIELFTDGTWQVKLLHVLDNGPDYERVSFAVC
ncbi:hypothetical protein [Propionivibrio sp.]|uniref:hypothetical protein n=1 Tax=Propionivibrio sp. TaxID=2212460 RepID=UPI003BF31100